MFHPKFGKEIMLKNFLRYFKNPIVVSALITAILIYTGLIPVRETNPFKSAVPIEKINAVSGRISSNPSRSGSGRFYTARIRVSTVKSREGQIEFSSKAAGELNVRIPSAVVESIYPGRLYSLNRDSVLIENGEIVTLHGSWSEKFGAFYADFVDYGGYEHSFFGIISHFRAMCRLIFKRLLYSWAHAGGLILSLLSGSREYLEDGLGDSFRNAGLSHILALSGMHLSFFSSLAGGVGKGLGGKRISLFAQFFGILFFVWFAGLSPSLFRALICSLISLLAKTVFCARVKMIEVLCCTFLIHAVLIPGDLFSAAFLLSYGALGGILIFADLINNAISPAVPPQISPSLSASMGAQIATSPISAKIFGCISPIGIISTVFISPLISFFLVLALIFIILSLAIPFLSPLFGSIISVVYSVIVWIVRLFAKVPPIDLN